MGTDYQFRENHCFYLPFFSKSRTNYSFQGKTNNIKIFVTTRRTDFSSHRNILQKLPPVMPGQRYCVLEKIFVKTKLYFSSYKLNFWLVKCIPSDFFRFQIVKTFSVQWRQYAFVQSFFSDVGNHYRNFWKLILKEKHFCAGGNHFL